MRPLTVDTPKVLLEVGGHSLIHRAVGVLLSAGIREIGIVVGHSANKVINALMGYDYGPSLEFIDNPDWEGGNAVSLHAARSFVADEEFVLCMGDHIVAPEIVATMMSIASNGNMICVDSKPWHSSQLNDATKVLVGPEGYVVDIGKELTEWNAVDVGYFRLHDGVFDAIEELRLEHGIEVGLSDVLRCFSQRDRPFATCDIDGLFWADIDTVEDYQLVSRLIAEGVESDG